MTVKELKDKLANCRDDYDVVIPMLEDGSWWSADVMDIIVDDSMQAVSLEHY